MYTVGDLRPGAQHPNDMIALVELIPLSESHHLVTCPYQHAMPISYEVSFSGKHKVTGGGEDFPTPAPYWNCPNDPGQCSLGTGWHKMPCRGGCGDLFPQYGWTGLPADYPHKTACNEQAIKTSINWGLTGGTTTTQVNCPGDYYSCAGVSTCTNASNHVDDDDDDDDSTAMHLCNDHEEWQSGIHTAAACGLAGHFVCDNLDHSSSYTCNIPPCSNRVVPYCLALCPESSSHGSTTITAAPTPTPTPAPTPESTPILVSCGGNGWTGCTEQVSSENDHYVSSCSNCSNSYWTCRPVHGAVKHEPPRTCARNRCDNTFTLCSRPPCDVNSEWKCQ